MNRERDKITDDEKSIMSITKETHTFFSEYNDEGYIESHDKRQIITVKENKRKYSLLNDLNKEIVSYRIDGGLINDIKVDKCDYGIYTEDELLILVELKGSNYNHAITQILSTTKILGITKGSKKVKKLHARVVLSRGINVPNLRTSELTELKNLLGSFKGTIVPQSQQLEETLSKIQ